MLTSGNIKHLPKHYSNHEASAPSSSSKSQPIPTHSHLQLPVMAMTSMIRGLCSHTWLIKFIFRVSLSLGVLFIYLCRNDDNHGRTLVTGLFIYF